MVKTLNSEISRILQRSITLVWSRKWNQTDPSKPDGYRFIGHWNNQPDTPVEVCPDGLHVGVVSELKGYERFEWRKISGKVRKAWHSTGHTVPPETNPTARDGREKYKAILEKTAIVFNIKGESMLIEAQVPWDGEHWGYMLEKVYQEALNHSKTQKPDLTEPENLPTVHEKSIPLDN